MAETFESQWKRLLVYAPDLPFPMAQEFINTAYSRVLAAGPWATLRKRADFILPAPISVAATPTNGSVTVSSASAATAHVGRQIYEDHAPFYTIVDVSIGASYTLDRGWAGTTGATTMTVEQVYVVVPSDFLTFISVVDTDDNWRLHTGFTAETLDVWDAQRTSTGSSWIVASTTPQPSSIAASAGFPRYEFWPRPAAAKTFNYQYLRKPPLLSAASDTLAFPIRGDLVRHGALVEMSMWPGTAERPNPYFNMDLAREMELKFQAGLIEAQREDQEITQTAVQYADSDLPWAPLDAEFIQAHI